MKARRVITVYGLAAALLAAAWPAGADVPSTAPLAAPLTGTPILEVDRTAVDFGEIWQGEPAQGTVTITNTGDAPLTVEVKTYCGCTVPTRPHSPLPPGASDVMTISYDSVKRKGPARQRITLMTNDPQRPRVDIAVRGNVKPLYEATPSEGIAFGRLTTDQHAEQSIRLANRYDEPLKLRLKEGQDFGPFDVRLTEVEPGQLFELRAATRPPLTEGFTRVEVRLETGLERIGELRISVQADVQADVLCRPLKLRVDRRLIVPVTREVRLMYRTDRPVRVTKVEPSVPAITCEVSEPRAERGGATWSEQLVRISLPPGKELPPGNASVEIYTDASEPRFAKFTVTIEVVEGQPARTVENREDEPTEDE